MFIIMAEDTFTFLVGGKAGEGVKKAGSVAANLFASRGRNVFQMDDYMSLIKGGHNFSVVTSALRKVYSQYSKANLIICFDMRSYDNHHEKLADDGILVYNSDEKDDMKGIGVPLTAEANNYPIKNLILGVGAWAI